MPAKPKPIAERYWPKVNRQDSPDACWNWTGAITKTGYGQLHTASYQPPIKAHRLAWVLAFGPIPPQMLVCHTCDNRLCCRPSHLFLGTIQDNADDMVAKRRFSMPAAKMTPDDIRAIRARLARGEMQKAIRADYGLSTAQLSRIASRQRWAHLP
jgi:hypothetical protein